MKQYNCFARVMYQRAGRDTGAAQQKRQQSGQVVDDQTALNMRLISLVHRTQLTIARRSMDQNIYVTDV